MTVSTTPDRAALGIGLLALVAIATGWLLIQGAPFVLGCLVMVALVAAEVALLVRPTPARVRRHSH